MAFERRHAKIVRSLAIEIVSGKRQPGDTLLGEFELSSTLGVSRSVVREAMRVLAAKGLVESAPKTGTTVLPRPRWNMLDPDILEWRMESGPTDSFIRDIFELRMVVEPNAAAFAAARRTPRDLTKMGHALAEMEMHGLRSPAGRAADETFHNILLEATRNEPLMALSSLIGSVIRWTTLIKYGGRQPARDPMPDHYAVFEAIGKGSAEEARAAMARLIELALEDTQFTIELRDGSSPQAAAGP